MDHHVDERDYRLLAGDRYTFSVLSRVLHGPCALILSDHAQLIFCHTTAPYPVWLWTPDGPSPELCDRAWQLICRHRPFSEGHRYNLKYDLAHAVIARAAKAGQKIRVATNMYAYDCPGAIAPDVPADGHLHRCTDADLDVAAQLVEAFHRAVHEGPFDAERHRRIAEEHVAGGNFFLWQTDAGEVAGCCSIRRDAGLGCVGSVYVRPEFRRRHYAQHMVYRLTRLIGEEGLTPMLYTDADYAASNACYEKIGYVLRGKLCTISAE